MSVGETVFWLLVLTGFALVIAYAPTLTKRRARATSVLKASSDARHGQAAVRSSHTPPDTIENTQWLGQVTPDKGSPYDLGVRFYPEGNAAFRVRDPANKSVWQGWTGGWYWELEGDRIWFGNREVQTSFSGTFANRGHIKGTGVNAGVRREFWLTFEGTFAA